MFDNTYLRFSLFPKLIKIGAKIGIPWEVLAKRYQRETILSQLDIMFSSNFPKMESSEKKLDIIFLAYLGCFQGNNIIQVTLGKILKEKGHRVRFLVCDIELPICESSDIKSHHNRSKICKTQLDHIKHFFKNTDFELILLSELLSQKEISDLKQNSPKITKWKSFEESMLLRYFKVGKLNKQDPSFKELSAKASHAALISARVGEKIAALNPDRVILSHGTYTTRGPARIVLNEANIPLVSISRAKMAESQKFNWKTAGDWWSVDEEWEKVKDIPLTKNQSIMIEDYLQSRRSHSRDIIAYNFTDEENRSATLKKLNLDENKKIYTLFTNVLWDAASAQREIAFNSPIEWTMETIKWFKNQKDKQLIVRIHPAEKIIGTQQPMMELIKENIKDFTDNIILLEPDAAINSWSLLKITDVGLVHTSTVGLELALEGIPSLCLSKTHYRGKGFTVDVMNKENYFDLLNTKQFLLFDSEEAKKLAKRYSYLVFLRYQIPLPFYNPKSHIGIHSFKKIDWKEIVDFPTINLILDSIEQKKPFLIPNELVSKLYKLN